MVNTLKTAILIVYLFTLDIESQKIIVSSSRHFGGWTRNIGQRLRGAWSSGVSYLNNSMNRLTKFAENMPARIKLPGFPQLCANLGKNIEVIEARDHKGGTSIGRKIKYWIKKLTPVELHLPGYKFCGPNTNLKLRLHRNDCGINKLDAACKEHDKGFLQYPDLQSRIAIDRILAWKAYERMKANDSSSGEKAAARVVAAVMCLKLQVTTKVNRVLRRIL